MPGHTLAPGAQLPRTRRCMPRAAATAAPTTLHTQEAQQHIDLYSLLGLDQSAAGMDIKDAFRARAKALHHRGRLPAENVATFRVRRPTLRHGGSQAPHPMYVLRLDSGIVVAALQHIPAGRHLFGSDLTIAQQ